MSIQKIRDSILIVILIISVIGLSFYNMHANPDFYNLSAFNALTLLIVIIVAYHLSQRKNDQRKTKDELQQLIVKIQKMVASQDAYVITTDTEPQHLLMLQRQLNNKLDLLKKPAARLGFKKELAYIEDRFKNYKDIIGNHINDLNYLSKSQNDLQKELLLMDDKFDFIRLKLYE